MTALRRVVAVTVLLLVVVPAEARRRPAVPGDRPPPYDGFSAAEPAAVRTAHLALDLEVDFEARRLRGSATHAVINLKATRRFIVDTRDLEILGVSVDGVPANWSLGPSSRSGQALTIDIEPGTRIVRIDYATSPDSAALRWLNALQTTGGVAPFFYTFSQPDHAREWIPLQDTPGVRMSYEATVRVPPGLLALMSARNPTEPSADGLYHFEMPYPIPPYLIALAVGRLEFRPLGDRTGFYAEPEFLEDAAWDLQYIPQMLEIAEEMMGDYPFERYDLLLGPPGFLAGGMENPMLNFLNILGAVNSNMESPPVPNDLLAHELAHSWAGDLVTCATWSDTWLNEGFATYYSRRILEEMMGRERSEIGFYWDRQNFESYMTLIGANARQTVLHREFGPTEPPSIFTPTNYSKGSMFLKMLEDRLGREAFDQAVRSYFRRYALQWVDERAFLDELGQRNAALQLDAWIYGTGLPNNLTAPERSALWDRVGVQANRFRSGVAASRLQTGGWRSFELGLFLWQVTDLVPQRMAELDTAFGLSAMKTPSIHWFLGVASALYGPGMPMFERYLLLGGPNVLSLYYRLVQTAAGRAYALAFYERARPRYAPNIQDAVDAILGVHSSALREAA